MLWSFVGRILLARWLVIGVVMLGSLTGGLFVVVASEPMYDATARVILNIYKPDPITGAMLGRRQIDPYLQTQLNLIRDFQVVGPAIEAVGWLDDPDIVSAYNARPPIDQRPLPLWLAETVLASMTVNLVEDSNIIAIRYRGASPEVAELVAGALRDSYIAASIRQRRSEALASADAQAVRVDRTRLDLADLQAQKRAIEAETGVILARNGTDLDGDRLLALSSPPPVKGQSPAPIFSTARGAGRGALAKLDIELAQAAATLGPRHPRLAELRASRDFVAARVAAGEQASGNAAAVVVARERAKGAAFDAQRTKVLSQRQDALRLRILQDQINLKGAALEEGMKQIADLRQLSTSIESGLTSVGSVEREETPSFPNIPLILGGTGGIGMIAGILIALVVEMFDLRVRTLSGLRIATGVPVLGRIPALHERPETSVKRRWKFRRSEPVTV